VLVRTVCPGSVLLNLERSAQLLERALSKGEETGLMLAAHVDKFRPAS
jgi:hypothetical protein